MTPLLSLLALAALQSGAPGPGDEARYWTVDYLRPPEGAVLEVGGIGRLSDGRLVVSTRRGQVWLVSNPLAEDPADAHFTLFAEGLQEGLGLNVVDDAIWVVQRGELSRLVDEDGDDRCDRIDTIANGWGLSGNYHEFAYGLPRDAEGDFYVSLNVSFFNPEWWHGKSTVPWRGWLLRITPEGVITPFASGFRSPCGLGIDLQGRLLLTDNQGDWLPASPVYHVQEGGWYGHPASLRWTEAYRDSGTEPSDTVPPARATVDRRPAAVWLPYEWSRSPGSLVPDTTEGRFGPFAGQTIVAELTNGMILRLMLEEVEGETQGACAIVRRDVGSAVRVAFADEDGTLFCGLTNRGWGGRPPAQGIARVRWTGETPMEVREVHLEHDGFRLELTLPLADGITPGPDDVQLVQYDYDYWWEYGSPKRDLRAVHVDAVTVSPDRRTLFVRTPMARDLPADGGAVAEASDGAPGGGPLEAGRVARIKLANIVSVDGRPLLHDDIAYTVNQLPGAPLTPAELATNHVAKVVPPPPARESQEQGWLRLTYGDATALWDFHGWELDDAELDPDDPTRISTRPGVSALTNTAGPDPSPYVSKVVAGDATVHLEFMLPQGGDAGLYLMGRYEVCLSDRDGVAQRTPDHTGGIPASPGFAGSAPSANAYQGPGLWHQLDVSYEAPRFDDTGRKVTDAKILQVSIDDVTVQEEVEVPEPSPGAPLTGEAPEGPVAIVARSPLAIGNVRLKPEPVGERTAEEGWKTLVDFDEETLDGWTRTGAAEWSFDDGVLVGEGPRGDLLSPESDLVDCEVHGRFKISDGGCASLFLRAAPPAGDPNGQPEGYEVRINSTFASPAKTGSILGLAPIPTQLVPADTWFDLRVTCRDEGAGTRVRVAVDGVVVNDLLDPGHRFAGGHVALQQHHEGSVLEVRALSARRLGP